MTLYQTALAFIQQAQADGVHFISFSPKLEAEGPPEILARWGAVARYLRERAAAHPARPDIDGAIATAAEVKLPPYERRLVRRIGDPGRFVWVNSDAWKFGRLEAVAPGLALVTVHPNPVLPAEPVARWKARTEKALPFGAGLVELDELEQVIAYGFSRIMGIQPELPGIEELTTDRPGNQRPWIRPGRERGELAK